MGEGQLLVRSHGSRRSTGKAVWPGGCGCPSVGHSGCGTGVQDDMGLLLMLTHMTHVTAPTFWGRHRVSSVWLTGLRSHQLHVPATLSTLGMTFGRFHFPLDTAAPSRPSALWLLTSFSPRPGGREALHTTPRRRSPGSAALPKVPPASRVAASLDLLPHCRPRAPSVHVRLTSLTVVVAKQVPSPSLPLCLVRLGEGDKSCLWVFGVVIGRKKSRLS